MAEPNQNVWKTEMDGRAPQPKPYRVNKYSDGSRNDPNRPHPGSPETDFPTLSSTADQITGMVGNIILYRTLFNNKSEKKDSGPKQTTLPKAPGLGSPGGPSEALQPKQLGPGATPMHERARGPMPELGPGPGPAIALGPVPQQVNRSSETFNPKSPGMNPGARRELPGNPTFGRSSFQPDLTPNTRPGKRGPAGMDPRRRNGGWNV